METPPPPIDPSLLDPHKRSLRPGVSPRAAKPAGPTQAPKPNPKPPVSRPKPPSPQQSIPPAAGPAKPSTTESKSEKPNSKASSEQPSATNETQKRHSAPLVESIASENGAKSQPPDDSSEQQNGKDGSGMAGWIAATIILAILVIVFVAASKNTEIESLKREIAQLTEREAVQQPTSNAQSRKGDDNAARIERLEILLADRNETIARKEREIARLEREKATLQSEKADALRRASSAESELASEMNRATAAMNRAREAERRLAVAKTPSMTTASKSTQDPASEPKDAWIVVSATLDGKPVKGATLKVSDRTFSLPRKFPIRKGNKTKPGTVFYRRNGVDYVGQMSSVFVDWTGEQTVVIPLTSKDSCDDDDDDFDLDRALRSSYDDTSQIQP